MCATRAETQAIMDRHRDAAIDIMMRQDWLVADQFEHQVQQQQDRTALIFEGQRYSWRDLNERVEDFACRMLACGLKPGDSCAIMIENRPEFLFAWLGANKIGVTAGLLNTSARGKALHHALTSSRSSLLLLGDECFDNLADSGLESEASVRILRVADTPEREARSTTPSDSEPTSSAAFNKVSNTNSGVGDEKQGTGSAAERETTGTLNSNAYDTATDIDSIDLNPFARPNFKALRRGFKNTASCSYVFTSGTTGLPKAANVSHGRYMAAGAGWKATLGLSEQDVFYCSLPLFHSSALLSLYGTALITGGAVFLRRKFSVSNFWKDVQAHHITVFQYIGEVCRYLTQAPDVPEQNNHSLRFLLGSGMGADVWNRFTSRFGEHIRIIEGWGSTESNCAMSNFDQKPGACGRTPYPENSHMRLFRYDQVEDQLERDAEGRVILCQPGEVGELHGQIQRGNGDIVSPFEGYTSPEATEAKIVRNAVEQGDAWWRSGDLFRFDDEGYFYFVDRIGDTFRWKGENVSTQEVAQLLSDYADAETINVYGVKVPGHEGRAGMVAITLRADAAFDPDALYQCAQDRLAHYARPLFVRVLSEADITANFKLRKVRLRDEGFDRSVVTDALYGLDEQAQTYSPLSDALLQQLGIKN